MPLLTLKTHSKPHTIKINLDSNTLERLKNYCVYAHGDLDSAVREALIYVFDRDKDFKAMEQQIRQQQATGDSASRGSDETGQGAKAK